MRERRVPRRTTRAPRGPETLAGGCRARTRPLHAGEGLAIALGAASRRRRVYQEVGPCPRVRFELLGRDGGARLGKWETPHGTVRTPALLPVIHPGQQAIPASEMHARFGVEMVITNSYIAWRNPALREKALRNGIRDLIGFPGPVMTDSGTFQMYFYGKTLEVDNATIVGFQRDIGSTVGTILDIFATPDMSEEQAGQAVDTTLDRAREAQAHKGSMGLALPVQGGVFPALRTRCAQAMGAMEAAMHPIGGVVPLMEGQRYRDLVEVIGASQQGLPPGRPVHLFGAGHPLVFPIAALMGCDLFDSAAYSKFAQDDRYLLPDGTALLGELEELPCPCAICASMSAKELRLLPNPEREAALARHNLHVSMAELRRVREAIRQGRLWELVEQRCRAHPALLDALRSLATQSWLERREPTSKPQALFYTGSETLARPTIVRLRQRLLTRYRSPTQACVVVEHAQRPFARSLAPLWARARGAGIQVLVKTPFAAIPVELDEMYPAAQSADPELWDREAGKGFTRFLDEMLAAHGWKLLAVEEAEALPLPERAPRLDVARIEATAAMQFGRGAPEALLQAPLHLRKSATTGRVRNVLSREEHVLSVRAPDGLFTLKLAGARRLHAALPAPSLRVVVDADAAPFARQGKNVFARFVKGMDPELRPGDECLVVDQSDALLACGRVVLMADEVRSFQRGVAVDVREGIERSGHDDEPGV
jgi:7-cyano-7-deazaguanine tRNA-ribosyltransferase